MINSGNLPKTGTLIRVLMGGSFERRGVDSSEFTGSCLRVLLGRLIRSPFHLLHGHMISKQLPGLVLFALLLVFIGSFVVHRNQLGQTLASAIIPVPVEKSQQITAEEVEQSRNPYHDLVEAIRTNPSRLAPLPASKIDSETLWLARAIYSETKRPEEMELVAWVIRNRVETRYRGRSSYRDVVLDPFQFSAFNPGSGKRLFYSSLTTQTQIRSWQSALTIAYRVRSAAPEFRPFSVQTRHFFSERSMFGRNAPAWAIGQEPVKPERSFTLDERRFRFYEGIS